MLNALVLCVATIGALQDEPKMPAAATHRVDFHKEILPILQRRCAECHVGPNPKGKLGIATRSAILKGGESGPAAIAGKGGESLLVELAAGLDPDRIMPASNRPRLSAEEVGVLRAWIDQGMAWEEGVTISRPVKTARLEPRRPEVPAVEPGAHRPTRSTSSSSLITARTASSRARSCPIGCLPGGQSSTSSACCRLPRRSRRWRGQSARQASAVHPGPARRPRGLCRALAHLLERRAPERLSRDRLHRRRPPADHGLALQGPVRRHAV